MDDLMTLLADAEAYAKRAGLKLSTVSNKLFGHGKRIKQYRAGEHSPSLKTIKSAREKLSSLNVSLDEKQQEAA